jgi:hypothetical protein
VADADEAAGSMEDLLHQARPLSALAALLREEEQGADAFAAAASQDGCIALPAAAVQPLQRRVHAVALAVPQDSQVLPSLPLPRERPGRECDLAAACVREQRPRHILLLASQQDAVACR